jgi:hypothetical protein
VIFVVFSHSVVVSLSWHVPHRIHPIYQVVMAERASTLEPHKVVRKRAIVQPTSFALMGRVKIPSRGVAPTVIAMKAPYVWRKLAAFANAAKAASALMA